MTDNPSVTIVIPVYNGSDYLAEAIDSALAQTYRNIEILVVNDGSNDGGATERVAQSYGDKIRYVSKPNGGVASALNRGIAEMRGEYFSWLSHDDLYVPEKVEREMDALRGSGDSRTIVYSNFEVFSAGYPPIPIHLKQIRPEQFRYWITAENSLHGCTLLIPKSAFSECGLFDESLRTTQDYDLWFRMAGKYRFTLLPDILVRARSHPEQGTRKMGDTVLTECNALLTRFIDNLSPAELKDGRDVTPAVAYAQLSRSFSERGFNRAARRAASLALRNFAAAGLRGQLAVLSLLLAGGTVVKMKSWILNGVRAVLPPPARRAARQVLGAMRRQPQNAQVDAVRNLSLKEKFSEVYAKNIFGGADSRSGAGSDLAQTEVIRAAIPRILRERNVRSMLDAPCGDWFWMREVDLGIEKYTGADIVEALIARNQSQFGREGIEFKCLDLSKDELPKVDLIFSRDCLVHLSYADAQKMLANFKASGAKFLLTTTFTGRSSNTDLGDGFWRPLNMQLAPFNFPPPIEIVNERCTEGGGNFGDKSIGLWVLRDIPATWSNES